MWRVRFHGRGGQGIKTSSRILGAAAFLSGLHAQDAPLYGAERRGAALSAFTRFDSEPIRERGPITDPDLILVGDETLLADPAAAVLGGRDFASAVFVNSPREASELAAQHAISCPVLTADLTALATELLGRGAAVSAALGAVACALAGLKSVEVVARAVQQELADLHLAPDSIDQNVAIARRAHARFPAIARHAGERAAGACPLHVPTYAGRAGIPILYTVANSLQRHTGAWRIFRPVIDLDACTRCGICFALCPDGAIALSADGSPRIDYEHCKGCLLCSQECPIHCIHEAKEVRAW